jgi:hypothetical protein
LRNSAPRRRRDDQKRDQKPKLAEEFTLPVASGVVAGGSLMGVVLVFWANGGSILSKLLGG